MPTSRQLNSQATTVALSSQAPGPLRPPHADLQLTLFFASDNTVRMWEMGGSCLSVLRGHTSRIWDVDATSTGEFIASASGDKTVRVWRWRHDDDHDIQECRQVLKGNNGDVYAARWHPLGVGHSSLRYQSSSRDGQNHVVSAGYDRIVRLFDVEGGNIIKTFTGHALSISSIVFNPLGNLIISGYVPARFGSK